MNQKDWRNIEEAAALLQLGETATLGEIKRAYRHLSKKYHPDTKPEHAAEDEEHMYRLTAAYELLRRYCETYRFPLQRPDNAHEYDLYDPQEWWRARFGQDPIWGDKKSRR
jgi:DnaJ-class molecular chaperone